MKPHGPEPLPQAFFLRPHADAHDPQGQRFCLYHAPASAPDAPGHNTARVLYLHPFAEELNHTRLVVATQARALAQAGFAVLQIDLLGCGDSSGGFEDARWNAWLQDAELALDWLQSRAQGPLWIWGLRSGALLAAALAERLERVGGHRPNLLFWQPVPSGQQMLQQFLRLHAAGQWLQAEASGDAPASAAAAPAQALQRGEAVDIAGYGLTPALAHDLRQLRLQPVTVAASTEPLPQRRLVWLELSTQADPRLNPGALQQQQAWREAGWQVQAEVVRGPAFWQTLSQGAAAVRPCPSDTSDTASTAPLSSAFPLLQATLAALRQPLQTPCKVP